MIRLLHLTPRARVTRFALLFAAVVVSFVLALMASAQTAHFGGMQTMVTSGFNAEGVAIDASGNLYVPASIGKVYKETVSGSGYTQTTLFTVPYEPGAIAIDAAGDIFLTNTAGGIVEKYTYSAGTYSAGVAIASGLGSPSGIAVDNVGNVYVADAATSVIYKLVPAGGPYNEVPIVSSGLAIPNGIAVDSNGNLYIADFGHNRIAKATLSNGSYTVAGVGPAVTQPINVAVDASGNLAVTTSTNLYQEPLANGAYTQTLIASNLTEASGVLFDSQGALYVSELVGQTLTRQTLTANFGSSPVGTAIAPQTLVFVFDTGGVLDGNVPVEALTQGVDNLDYTDPGAGRCDSGQTFSAGETCTVIAEFKPAFSGTRNGAFVLNGGNGARIATGYVTGLGLGPQLAFPAAQTTPFSGFNNPLGVAVDAGGNVYIADSGDNQVLKETLVAGSYTQSAVGSGFSFPTGVAVDGAGNLFISDGNTGKVFKESLSAGAYTQTTAMIISGTPQAIAVDGNGDIYLADSYHFNVYKATPSGSGYNSALIFNGINAFGIAVDPSGDVFLANSDDNQVVKLTPSGGSYTSTPVGSGFDNPAGLALDGNNNLYVADNYGQRVVRETLNNGSYTPNTISFVSTPTGLAINGNSLYVLNSALTQVSPLNAVLLENLGTPPTVTFDSTFVGTTSADSPEPVTLENVGNQPLVLTQPGTGLNPSVAAPNFSLSQTASTCAIATSTTAASIPAETACSYAFSFTPTVTGNPHVYAILTDNNLNLGGNQQINLTGASAKGNQTITFPQPPSPLVYAANEYFALGATSSSGLPINYQISGPASNSDSNGIVTLHYLGVGTVTVTASQSGSSNYLAATPVTITIQLAAAPSGSYSAPSSEIGTPTAAQTVTLLVTTAGTTNATLASAIKVLTQGAPNLDFTYASGGTCAAGTAYVLNQTCTVNVIFNPRYTGPRYGAVVLADANGNPLATAYLQGTGLGPQAVLSPTQIPFGSFNFATAIAVDGAGNVYIADAGTNQVVKETLSNGVYTLDPTPLATGLGGPYGVAVDGAGNVFVADSGNNQVLEEISTNGAYTPRSTPIATNIYSPNGLALDGAGNLYIAVAGSNKVIKETLTNGVYNTQSPITVATGLNSPDGVAVDGAGNVYIANFVGQGNNADGLVYKVTYSGGVYSSPAIIAGNLGNPSGVAVDGDGNVYFVDAIGYTSRGIKLTYSGGTYSQSYFGSGLNGPYGIAIDGAGNTYIADTGNDRALLENVTTSALSFPSTASGVTSAPLTTTLSNIGTDPLTLPVPAALMNPQTALYFSLETNSDTTCPIEYSGGGTAGSLAPNASCILSYVFQPIGIGGYGSDSELFDNSLNNSNAYQIIRLTGTGSQGTQTITFPSFGNTGSYVSGISFPLSATSSAGLPITYTASANGGLTATITGTTANPSVTITGAVGDQGNVLVTASQPGTADYAAAASVTQFVLITNIVSAPPSTSSFPDTQVGQSSMASVNIFLTAAGQSGQVQALLQGVPGLDYAASLANSNCSVGANVLAGNSCTVSVTFSPRYAGPRYGAVNLLDGSGNILGTAYLYGKGLGPQIAFAPVQAPIGSGLNQPEGAAVDGAGNVFVADHANNRVVEEVYSGGVYTQLPTPIGSGLSAPTDVAIDGAGNLYITTDGGNSVVKEVLSGGVYTQSTVLIGTGLTRPQGLAVDQAGDIFIADSDNSRVVEEIFSGGVYTQSSSPIGSGLDGPFSVAVDNSGNVYIADSGNDRVLEEVYSGGTYTQVPLPSNGLSLPLGIAVDSEGNVYVSDGALDVVVEDVLSGGVYTQSPTPVAQGLDFPVGLAVDAAGNVYIADTIHSRVLVETVSNAPALSFPSTATGVTSAPVATTITNLGNQPLVFPVPASGTDPATSTNFSLETNSDTTCPVVNAGGTAATLAANATCTLSYVFAPTVVAATVPGTSVLTDNNLNLSSVTQTVNLTGVSTQGTQTAQSITFPQPAGTVYPGTATLAATASSGLPVTYTLNSGPATLSGSTLTYTGPGTVSITASQLGNAPYSAAVPVTINLNVTQAEAEISWIPSTLRIYTGTTLTGVLDATDSIPSTITYSAFLLPAGTPFAVTSTNVLPQGNYGLTATVTPTDPVHFATTSVTLLFSVQNMNVFIANSVGSVSSLYNNGQVQSAPAAGGGIGAAVDGYGFVWSINSDGNGFSRFSDGGVLKENFNGVTGVSAASALAIDGHDNLWIANGNGTVSSLSNYGTPIGTGVIGRAAGLNAPASVNVDASGSLWIANSGNNTVTEIIGVATPVTTPTAQAVYNNSLGTQP